MSVAGGSNDGDFREKLNGDTGFVALPFRSFGFFLPDRNPNRDNGGKISNALGLGTCEGSGLVRFDSFRNAIASLSGLLGFVQGAVRGLDHRLRIIAHKRGRGDSNRAGDRHSIRFVEFLPG